MEQPEAAEEKEAQPSSTSTADCRIVHVFSLAEEAMEIGTSQENDDQTSTPNPNLELIIPNPNLEELGTSTEQADVVETSTPNHNLEELGTSTEQVDVEASTPNQNLEQGTSTEQADVEEVPVDDVSGTSETISHLPPIPGAETPPQIRPEEDQSQQEINGTSAPSATDVPVVEEVLDSRTCVEHIDIDLDDASQASASTAEELSQANQATQPYLDLRVVKRESHTNPTLPACITIIPDEQPSTSTILTTVGLVPVTNEEDQPPASHSDQEGDDDTTVDLLTCHICLSEINNPKSLPCLHTFCRTCLVSWVQKCPQVLTCPTCQEECPIPLDGIEGLKGNFFVTKLKDRRNLKRKLSSPEKIMCSACDSGLESDSRCLDCDDFLCSRCVDMHVTLRILKCHQVIKLTELRSGKVNIFKVPRQQQEQCKKHIGQIMWFYCETCGMLICRDCTVVDHCRPEHTYVNLVDAIRGQRQNIKGLSDDCKKILKEVESEMAILQKHDNQLTSTITQASSAVDSAADRALVDLQECVEAKRNDQLTRIRQIGVERKTTITSHREKLLSLTMRLKTALDVGKQLTEDGSEFEIASTFQSLLTTLQQLKTTKLPPIKHELSKLSFEINEGPLFTIHELGTVRAFNTWKLVSKFGRGNDGSKPITKAWAVTITKEGNIAVANNSSSGNVSLHSKQSPHQSLLTLETSSGLGRNPSGWKSFPRGVAVASNNHIYITDNTMFVKEYDSEGNFIHQFGAVHPNGEESDKMKITLDSVAVDRKGNLLVGPNQHKFLSIHNTMSYHIRSFNVPIEPHFIATAKEGDEIVLSSHIGNAVHVIDSQGNTLHILEIDDIPVWRPRGLCVTKEAEILVSNAIKDKSGEAAGIYRFTLTGKYLGCATKDVMVPYGLALSEDEQTLVVGDKKMVSVFELC